LSARRKKPPAVSFAENRFLGVLFRYPNFFQQILCAEIYRGKFHYHRQLGGSVVIKHAPSTEIFQYGKQHSLEGECGGSWESMHLISAGSVSSSIVLQQSHFTATSQLFLL